MEDLPEDNNFEDNLEKLKQGFMRLLSDIERLNIRSADDLNEESQQHLEALAKILFDISEKMHNSQAELLNDLYGKSMHMYYEVKEAARNGDKEAQDMLETLAPIFRKSLKETLSLHLN